MHLDSVVQTNSVLKTSTTSTASNSSYDCHYISTTLASSDLSSSFCGKRLCQPNMEMGNITCTINTVNNKDNRVRCSDTTDLSQNLKDLFSPTIKSQHEIFDLQSSFSMHLGDFHTVSSNVIDSKWTAAHVPHECQEGNPFTFLFDEIL
jgi:hypothetical protein